MNINNEYIIIHFYLGPSLDLFFTIYYFIHCVWYIIWECLKENISKEDIS